jgi:hypothetical protein
MFSQVHILWNTNLDARYDMMNELLQCRQAASTPVAEGRAYRGAQEAAAGGFTEHPAEG